MPVEIDIYEELHDNCTCYLVLTLVPQVQKAVLVSKEKKVLAGYILDNLGRLLKLAQGYFLKPLMDLFLPRKKIELKILGVGTTGSAG